MQEYSSSSDYQKYLHIVADMYYSGEYIVLQKVNRKYITFLQEMLVILDDSDLNSYGTLGNTVQINVTLFEHKCAVF